MNEDPATHDEEIEDYDRLQEIELKTELQRNTVIEIDIKSLIYRFVDFFVDRLADLVDRICGQILVINSGQILWTNLCTFV